MTHEHHSLRRAIRVTLRAAPAAFALVTTYASLAAAAPLASVFPLKTLEPAHGGDGSQGVFLYDRTAVAKTGITSNVRLDVNADGLDDVLFGAPGLSTCNGCGAFVVYGATDLPASFNLPKDPVRSRGADGFIFREAPTLQASGYVVSGVGDINGDGVDDFTLRIDADVQDYTYAAYVVYGRPGGFPPIFDGASLLPQNGGDGSRGFITKGAFSSTLSGGCDFNGDGISDLAVGDTSVDDHIGAVYVLFGRADGFPAEVDLRDLAPPLGDGSRGVVIEGKPGPLNWHAGYVACLGDTNGDGVNDLLVGAEYAAKSGEAFLVYGHSGPAPATIELAALLPPNGGDGSVGTVFTPSLDESAVGTVLAGIGDINGDGLADFAIGGEYRLPGQHDPGRAYLIFGRAGGYPAQFLLTDLLPENGGDGTQGVAMSGRLDDSLGRSIAGAGDFNADGFDDVIIGMSSFDWAGKTGAGGACLVFGRTTPFPPVLTVDGLLHGQGHDGIILAGGTENGNAGGRAAVAGPGDVNGDGFDDVVVGQPSFETADDPSRAYIVYGHATSN